MTQALAVMAAVGLLAANPVRGTSIVCVDHEVRSPDGRHVLRIPATGGHGMVHAVAEPGVLLWEPELRCWDSHFLANGGTSIAVVNEMSWAAPDDAGVAIRRMGAHARTHSVGALCPQPLPRALGPSAPLSNWVEAAFQVGPELHVRTVEGTLHRFRMSDGALLTSERPWQRAAPAMAVTILVAAVIGVVMLASRRAGRVPSLRASQPE